MSDNDKEKDKEKSAIEQQYETPHQPNDKKEELDNKHDTNKQGEVETEPKTDVNEQDSGAGADVRNDNPQAVNTDKSDKQEPKKEVKDTEKNKETTVKKEVSSSEADEPKSEMSKSKIKDWQEDDLTDDDVIYNQDYEYVNNKRGGQKPSTNY